MRFEKEERGAWAGKLDNSIVDAAGRGLMMYHVVANPGDGSYERKKLKVEV
jgi:hypothetical protein